MLTGLGPGSEAHLNQAFPSNSLGVPRRVQPFKLYQIKKVLITGNQAKGDKWNLLTLTFPVTPSVKGLTSAAEDASDPPFSEGGGVDQNSPRHSPIIKTRPRSHTTLNAPP